MELCKYILLIGYMRLLSKVFVDAFPKKIMNIHPSLLPKYPGMDLDVHKAVLEAGEKTTGATLHWVDEGVDTGEIIRQTVVIITEGETVESLKEKVQKREQEIIVEYLKELTEK